MTVQTPSREVLWTPENPRSTVMWQFMERVNSKYGLELKDYQDLYKWSIDNIGPFWEEVWLFSEIKASRPFDKVRPTSVFVLFYAPHANKKNNRITNMP